jgi:prepilin-type N-terminal cleavage/methylation domain-containing protein
MGWMRGRWFDAPERGFTVVEVLVTTTLLSVVLTLGAVALRSYWLNQALVRAEGSVVSELRNLQDSSVSQSNPISYGARFRPGSDQWGLLRFNGGADPDTCTESPRSFDRGVFVESVDFASAPVLTAVCRTATGNNPLDEFVFFFPRGTATGGQLTLKSTHFDDRSRTVEVTPITGKVLTP